MELVEYINDNPSLDDVSILSYAALRAAVSACASPAVVQKLLTAFQEAVGSAELVHGDLTDVKVLTEAAIDAQARTGSWNAVLVDALLDALREMQKDAPSGADITSAA